MSDEYLWGLGVRWLRYRLLVGLDVAQHWRWWPFRFNLRVCDAVEREYARRAERDQDFISELAALLNRHSKENGSGTPDFILAEYLFGCLAHFNSAVNRREAWYGREQDQISGMPVRDDRKDELDCE